MGKIELRVVVEYIFLNVKNTQEVYDNMGDISGINALKYIQIQIIDKFIGY